MDSELVNVINYIQAVKLDIYKKHKPALIDGKSVIMNQNNVTQGENTEQSQPKAYIRLIQQHRRTMYRNDYEAQENAAKREQEQDEKMNAVNDANETDKVKITLSGNTDIHKPWSKIPNSSKIQLLLKFIDTLSPQLSDEQKGHLRYLLISSNSQKKLSKQSDVEYDPTNGYIMKINRLTYSDGNFILLDENNDVSISFPFSVQIPPTNTIKKKLILLKK